MTTYAGVRAGWVVELFTPLPQWEHFHPDELFAKELFDAWVPIDGLNPKPAYGWEYVDGNFRAPAGDADHGRMRRAMLVRAGFPETF